MVISLISFAILHYTQTWFADYTKKHSDDTDNMLSRMFWGVTTKEAQKIRDLGKKVLYLKLGILSIVVVVGTWGIFSLCKDSMFGISGFVVVLLSGVYTAWGAWREEEAKKKEEEEKKNEGKPKLFDRDGKLPVTIVTGFLGAGKTTLVNHILHEQQELKILVIENEVGQQGIDHKLLIDIDTEEVILLNNGCVCCKVRSDLLQVLKALLVKEQFAALDGVLIETTGIADPAPVIQTFMMDDDLKEKLVLDGVICMVDAKHVVQHLEAEGEGSGKEETVAQIAFADTVLVNKLDLITQNEVKEVATRLALINSEARIIFCEKAQVAMKDLIGLQAYDTERATQKLQARDSMPWARGVLNKAPVCQPVGTKPAFDLGFVPGSGKSSGGTHGISTVSIVLECSFDIKRLNRWLASLLKERGADLYRMKGIVAVEGEEEMYIFHGVHMIFTGKKGPKWPEGEVRESRMVFIGRRLQEDSLRLGFAGCSIKDISETLHDVE